jgi:hypothetical protein
MSSDERLDHKMLQPGQRVYVKNVDVFGVVSPDKSEVILEHPMPGYRYQITHNCVLIDPASIPVKIGGEGP